MVPHVDTFSSITFYRMCLNFADEYFPIIPNYNQHDATFLNLFISTDAVHVSSGSSDHRQEHITVRTASGIVNQYCCLLLSWMRWNEFLLVHDSSKQQYWLTIPEALCTIVCSWWWAEEPLETCRTSVEINKEKLHLVGSNLELYLRCTDIWMSKDYFPIGEVAMTTPVSSTPILLDGLLYSERHVLRL
jgi:hypothetical protein